MSELWSEQDLRYAEWFAWAQRELSPNERTCHAAALAALRAEQDGKDEAEARRVARQSILGLVPDLAEQVDEGRRLYAQWYVWARGHVKGDPPTLHRATQAAMYALRDGEDPAAAARQAGGSSEPAAPPAAAGAAEAQAAPGSGLGEPEAPPPAPEVPDQLFAGFWLRLGALMVDLALLLVLLLLIWLVVLVIYLIGGGSGGLTGYIAFVVIFWALLGCLYRLGLEACPWQATVGKRAMGICVTTGTGEPLSSMRALLRTGAFVVACLPLGAGLLLPLFTARRQALHDLLADTLVVRQEYVTVVDAALAHLAEVRTPSLPPPPIPSS
ncbi:MAG TPA: RDD family protein [Candidatus Dormibacteraeota bacterium]|jgi:uncharacterized RDD family membrane protein YckC|nr:RDD family protein [Candidatus Dormibacteraeota bacterium]